MAVKIQEIQTATISTMAMGPIRVNPARALGLSRQIGSRKLPGNARDTAEMKLAHAPTANSRTSAITPKGRVLVILRSQRRHAHSLGTDLFMIANTANKLCE